MGGPEDKVTPLILVDRSWGGWGGERGREGGLGQPGNSTGGPGPGGEGRGARRCRRRCGTGRDGTVPGLLQGWARLPVEPSEEESGMGPDWGWDSEVREVRSGKYRGSGRIYVRSSGRCRYLGQVEGGPVRSGFKS